MFSSISKNSISADWANMNPEIGLSIGSFLRVKELLRCALVSKTWNVIFDNNYIWQDWLNRGRQGLPCSLSIHGEPSLNWLAKRRAIQSLHTFPTNHAYITTSSIFQDTLLTTGVDSQDRKKITMWDMKSDAKAKQYQTIDASVHKTDILFLTTSQDYILSASRDGSIPVWNMQTREYIHTLSEWHDSDDTLSLAVYKNFVVSNTADGVIRVWDITSAEQVRTLKSEIFVCDSMHIVGNRLIFGTSSYKAPNNLSQSSPPSVWNTDTWERIHNLTMPERTNYAIDFLTISGDKVAACFSDQVIGVWNFETGTLVATYQSKDEDINRFSSFHMAGDTLFMGHQNGLIQMWDIGSEPRATFQAYDGLFYLQVIDSILISIDLESIKIWNINSNQNTPEQNSLRPYLQSIEPRNNWDDVFGTKRLPCFHVSKNTIIAATNFPDSITLFGSGGA